MMPRSASNNVGMWCISLRTTSYVHMLVEKEHRIGQFFAIRYRLQVEINRGPMTATAAWRASASSTRN